MRIQSIVVVVAALSSLVQGFVPLDATSRSRRPTIILAAAPQQDATNTAALQDLAVEDPRWVGMVESS